MPWRCGYFSGDFADSSRFELRKPSSKSDFEAHSASRAAGLSNVGQGSREHRRPARGARVAAVMAVPQQIVQNADQFQQAR